MTISSETRKAGPFAGNGVTTIFPFTFKVFAKTDIKADIVAPNGTAITLVLDSDYSVALNTDQNSNPGGTITYPISGTPMQAGYSLVGLGDIPYLQPTDITNLGGFYPQVIEDALDRATIEIQQIAEIAGRAIVVGEAESASLTLPTAGVRAGGILAFDSSGNVEVLPITASVGAGDLRDEIGSDGKVGFAAGADFTPGTTTQFVLSRSPGSKGNLSLYFDAAYQGGDQIASIVGNLLTLTSPVPVGVQRVYVRTGTTLSISTPANGSVGAAQLASTIEFPGTWTFDQSPSVPEPALTDKSGKAVSTKFIKDLFRVNIMAYGGVADGVTDNTTAFNAALAACPAGKAEVIFPAGNFYFASGIVYAHPTSPAYGGFRLIGAGMGQTQLAFASGVGVAISVTHNTLFDSTRIEGMSILTKGVGADIGIRLNLATGLTPPLDSSVTIQDVNMRGADGFVLAQYWQYCVYVSGVSNVNFYNCNFSGEPVNGCTGVYIVQNGSSQIPVVFNFVGCQFNYLGIGFNYGAGVQGVTLTACNFVGTNIGVYIAPGISGMQQLTVTGCQFNSFQNSIFVNSRCGAVSIVNNYFLVPAAANGISLSNTLDYAIVGNVFNPPIIPSTGSTDIVIGAWSDNGGVITGNSFLYATTAIALGATSQFVNVQSNVYAHNTANVSNLGTNNTVGGGSQ